MSDLQDALDETDIYAVAFKHYELFREAARRVADGIPTPFCTTHNRTMPSTDSWHGHIGHHSPTEGCHIVQAVIALGITEDDRPVSGEPGSVVAAILDAEDT